MNSAFEIEGASGQDESESERLSGLSRGLINRQKPDRIISPDVWLATKEIMLLKVRVEGHMKKGNAGDVNAKESESE